MRNDQSCYDRYVREISQHHRISVEREAELSRIIHGSRHGRTVEKAVDEMIHANLLLVIHCLRDFKKFLDFPGIHITAMDLIAEGNIALMTAVRQYDEEYVSKASGRPVKFSAYACGIIRNRMRRALKMARLIRVPEQHFAYWSKMRQLEEEHGEDMSDEFLMDKLGVGASKLRKLRQSFESRVSMLEDIAGEDGESQWADLIPSTTAVPPDCEVDCRDMNRFLQNELDRLPDRTQQMISQAFLDEKRASLGDLSEQFGVSRERCRQVLAKGLTTLRARIESRGDHAVNAERYFTVKFPACVAALS
ncbi:MAG: sigma-70 family RNA polymerase sigma factor [Verrucomicrobiota bacterium]|nr:sigma-70 family RNA polymerase sigma factor [Verrucomicrobiota bacterium]